MGTYYPDKKQAEREIALRNTPVYANEREQIRSTIEALRRARGDEEVFDVHLSLLRRSRALQQERDAGEVRVRRLRDRIREARDRQSAPELFKRLSSELDAAKLRAEAVIALQAIYRTIGDALAWREFRYQRSAIASLGGRDPIAHLSTGSGLSAEIRRLDALWGEGTFAILNDLTNCLRHGDITAFRARGTPRIVVFEEVKATGDADPSSAQMKQLEKVVKLLNDGGHIQGTRDGEPLMLGEVPVQYQTYIDKLAALIARARNDTHVHEQFTPELLVEVWDETNPAGINQATAEARSAEAMRACGFTDGRETITVSSSLRRLRDRRPHHSFAQLAPLPLLPLPIDDVADVVHGAIDFHVVLHCGRLEDRFAEHDIRAEVKRGREAEHTFLRAERRDVAIEVPAHVREQIQIELMTIETLIAAVEWMLDLVENQGSLPNLSLGFRGEAAVWEAADPTQAPV